MFTPWNVKLIPLGGPIQQWCSLFNWGPPK